MPRPVHGLLEAEVGHHRGGHGVVRSVPVVREVAGEDREDHVAVDLAAVGVGADQPVGVAVVGDADVGRRARAPRRDHDLGVGRPAPVVDVRAVGAALIATTSAPRWR
jgi:hypothetical protein